VDEYFDMVDRLAAGIGFIEGGEKLGDTARVGVALFAVFRHRG